MVTLNSFPGISHSPLSQEELSNINAYWRAANYLSVGQIYLYANPLLREPLKLEHIKPRLLGHWGTTPGLNFVYVHLNRIIKMYNLNVIYICGPGHGGPGMVANTYLEGTYSDVYTAIQQNEEGMQRLFKQFSFPGGIPSHVAPETPGSIHEGGELGYAQVHAYGDVIDKIRVIQLQARSNGSSRLQPWPMIVLRTPKGWTGPKFVDGKPVEGTWRAHQVPVTDLERKPEHVTVLEQWMKSYKPEELFDTDGKLIPELAELAPKGARRMGSNPDANGGLLLNDIVMPAYRNYPSTI